MLAVHPRDDPEVDALGTRGLALAVKRAGAEALDIRRGHQRPGSAVALGLTLGQEPEMGELRPHE